MKKPKINNHEKIYNALMKLGEKEKWSVEYVVKETFMYLGFCIKEVEDEEVLIDMITNILRED